MPTRRLAYRTLERAEIDALLARHPWVAFEVDEVDGPFDWRSAAVHSTVYELTPRGPEAQARLYDQAVEMVRGLIPETFTEADPAPFRNVILRVNVEEVSRRASSTSAA